MLLIRVRLLFFFYLNYTKIYFLEFGSIQIRKRMIKIIIIIVSNFLVFFFLIKIYDRTFFSANWCPTVGERVENDFSDKTHKFNNDIALYSYIII